jgi:SAM-dependent methyltransferase
MSETLWKVLRPDWASLEEVLPHGSGKALDVGAGTGRNRTAIEKAGYDWTGCDIRACSGIIQADAHNLPFDDGTFDLVVIWQVMEFLHDPWKAASELNRVLRPGGTVAGSVSYLEPMQGETFFYFSKNGLTEILRKSGFEDIFLSPGIGCFPLISWTWMRQFTGNKILMKGALWGARIGVWSISLIFDSLSAIKHALGRGHSSRRKWLREVMPYRFAGQITFRATKGTRS